MSSMISRWDHGKDLGLYGDTAGSGSSSEQHVFCPLTVDLLTVQRDLVSASLSRRDVSITSAIRVAPDHLFVVVQ
jgi:hypothetical protein